MATLNTKQEDIRLLWWYKVEMLLVPAAFAHPSCVPLPSVPNCLDQEGDLMFSHLMLPC